jgi:hypothetical protein
MSPFYLGIKGLYHVIDSGILIICMIGIVGMQVEWSEGFQFLKHVLAGPILSSGCANARDPSFPSHNALDCGLQLYTRGSLSLKICKPFFVVIIRVSINLLLGKAMRRRILCPIGSLKAALRFLILPKVK